MLTSESNVFDKKSSGDNVGVDIDEIELYGPPLDKKWIGDIFGGGYGYSKRDPFIDKGLELARMFNPDSAVEGSASYSKDDLKSMEESMEEIYKPEEHDELKVKFDDVDFSRNEYASGEPSHDHETNSEMLETDLDSAEPKEYKRLFGYRLGNGFALGKRSKRSLQEEYLSHTNEPESPFDDQDEKRYFASDIGGRFARRSFGTGEAFHPEDDLEDEMVYYYPAKRYFHSDPGYRFAFGKRSNWKRYFGHVLGSGFHLGKRNDEGDNLANENGIIDGDDNSDITFLRPIETFSGDEQLVEPPYYLDGIQLDKRYGYVLGRGFRFDKRPVKRPVKRYGWVLGRGFFLRKRDSELDDSVNKMLQRLDADEEIKKRTGNTKDPHNIKRFGFLLGHGMHLGKRQEKHFSDYYDIPYKRENLFSHYKRRPFGHVLGNGFAFGKRSLGDKFTSYEGSDSNDELMEAEKRAFGHWLGHGFKLGKRSKEYPDDEYDKREH